MRSRTIDTYQAGLFGEDVAADLLEQAGWRILARRARTRCGELDIVARRRDMVAFVEVKLAGPGRTDVWEVITERSQHRLRRAAVAWMATNPSLQRGVMQYRFDVCIVHRDCDEAVTRIDHLENAF